MINRFIKQVEDKASFDNNLEYSSGIVEYDRDTNTYSIAYQQYGAEETFSIGQPVFDKDNNLMGYLGISLYENLDYSCEALRVPVERWTICLPTKHCAYGKQVYTYWQKENKGGLNNEIV